MEKILVIKNLNMKFGNHLVLKDIDLEINQMITKAGPEYKNGLLFQANAANEIYTSDNEYGKKIISRLNTFFKYNKEAKWQVGSQLMEGIAKQYGTTIQGLISKGINITVY